MKFTIDFFTLTISKMINTPLLLLETALLGRILGPIEFGKWMLILAAGTLLHNIFINWTHALTIRFGCAEWQQYQSLNKILNTRLPIVALGFSIIVLFLFTQPMHWLSYLYSLQTELAWLVFLATFYLWLSFETQSNLQARSLIAHQAVITPIITTFSIILLLFISLSKSLQVDFIITIVLITKCLCWGMLWIYGLIKTNFYYQRPTLHQFKTVLNFGWPIIPSLLLGYVSDWGDHIMLGIFCTSKAVGLWGASYQMMLGIVALNSIFVTVLLPWLSSRIDTEKNIDLIYLTTIMPTVLSLWLLLIVVVTTFYPFVFYIFMGDQFLEAETVLLILSLCIISNVFSSLYSILFNIQDRLRFTFVYNFIIGAINLTLSLFLIPRMGITGAAIATLISYLVGHLLYIVDQHLYLKVPLQKTIILFFVVLLIGLFQYFIGVQFGLRILGCLVSLLLLIYMIRKMHVIHPEIINRSFTGVLNPFGFLVRKTLINRPANEHA